jgi:hypothetical protein
MKTSGKLLRCLDGLV